MQENFRLLGISLSVFAETLENDTEEMWSQVFAINLLSAVIGACSMIAVIVFWFEANVKLEAKLVVIATRSYTVAANLEVNRRITAAYCAENIGKMYGIDNNEVFALVAEAQRERFEYIESLIGIKSGVKKTTLQRRFLQRSNFMLEGYWMYWSLASLLVYPQPLAPEEENTLSILSNLDMPDI